MDDLEFVEEVEALLAKNRSDKDVLDIIYVRTPRLCAMVRAREDDLADWRKAQANGDELGTCSVCGDFRGVDECDQETGALACQRCQVEAFRVRLAKHEEAAKELRAARADVLASNHPGFDGSGDRFWDALEGIEVLLQEDAVE